MTNQMLEVLLAEPDDFLKVKETLTRIGIASKRDQTLYQSCHILHKRGQYYIVHFKEMFALDGKETDLSEEDIQRRNTVALLLEQWKLVKVVSHANLDTVPVSHIKIIPFKDKSNWTLVSKYTIGKK